MSHSLVAYSTYVWYFAQRESSSLLNITPCLLTAFTLAPQKQYSGKLLTGAYAATPELSQNWVPVCSESPQEVPVGERLLASAPTTIGRIVISSWYLCQTTPRSHFFTLLAQHNCVPQSNTPVPYCANALLAHFAFTGALYTVAISSPPS
jgi:hypothetical protein